MSSAEVAAQHLGVSAEITPDTHGNLFHTYPCDFCGAGGTCRYRFREDAFFELVVRQTINVDVLDPMRVWQRLWTRIGEVREGEPQLWLQDYPGGRAQVSAEYPQEPWRETLDTPLPTEFRTWKGSPLESEGYIVQGGIASAPSLVLTASVRPLGEAAEVIIGDLCVGGEDCTPFGLPDWRLMAWEVCR
jgi:hypothetical protein